MCLATVLKAESRRQGRFIKRQLKTRYILHTNADSDNTYLLDMQLALRPVRLRLSRDIRGIDSAGLVLQGQQTKHSRLRNATLDKCLM